MTGQGQALVLTTTFHQGILLVYTAVTILSGAMTGMMFREKSR